MSEERFSPTEPGISHPFTRCTVRCTDDGRIVLMAGDSAGIILDEKTGVISIFGTGIRFISDDVMVNGKRLSGVALDNCETGTAIGSQLRRIDSAKG